MLENKNSTITYELTGARNYIYPYRIFDPADIVVYVDGVILPATQFNVNVAEDNVSINLAESVTGDKLTISRELPLSQNLNLPEHGKLPSTPLETQLDRQVAMIQQLAERLSRTFSVNPGSTIGPSELLRIINKAAQTTASNVATANDLLAAMQEIADNTRVGHSIGEIFPSSVPLDATARGCHLLDGNTLTQGGIYRDFINYIRTISASNPQLLASEAEWQAEVNSSGQCGKFVLQEGSALYRWRTADGYNGDTLYQEPRVGDTLNNGGSRIITEIDTRRAIVLQDARLVPDSPVINVPYAFFRDSAKDVNRDEYEDTYSYGRLYGERGVYLRDEIPSVGDVCYVYTDCADGHEYKDGTEIAHVTSVLPKLYILHGVGGIEAADYIADPTLDSGDFKGFVWCYGQEPEYQTVWVTGYPTDDYADADYYSGPDYALLIGNGEMRITDKPTVGVAFPSSEETIMFCAFSSVNTDARHIVLDSYAWTSPAMESGHAGDIETVYTDSPSAGYLGNAYDNSELSGTPYTIIDDGTKVYSVTIHPYDTDVVYRRYEMGNQTGSAGYLRLPKLTQLVAGIAASTDFNNLLHISGGTSGLYSAVRVYWYIQLTNGSRHIVPSDFAKIETELQNKADKDLGNLAGGLVPAGTVLPFAGTAIPEGYLLCDGAAVSRIAYPRLFAAVGSLYGAGNGSTTFNLPDFRGTFLRGYKSGETTELGTRESESLPALTGKVPQIFRRAGAGNPSGVFNWAKKGSYDDEDSGSTLEYGDITFETSGIYSGTHVIPQNYPINYIIKY